MAYQIRIITDVVENVNKYDFQKQVSKHNEDYKVSKLNCFNLLIMMILTHLKTNRTIRDICHRIRERSKQYQLRRIPDHVDNI
jgi:hypothetical protein